MAKLADIYNNQIKKPEAPKQKPANKRMDIVFHMPEVKSLIRHLDILYSSMLIQNANRGQGSMWETVAYFNPGQGAVRQSDQVS